MKNVFAHTANSHPYPGYISVNVVDPNVDYPEISVSVREPAKPGQYSDKDCGATAEIKLSWDDAVKLHGELGCYLDEKREFRYLKDAI